MTSRVLGVGNTYRGDDAKDDGSVATSVNTSDTGSSDTGGLVASGTGVVGSAFILAVNSRFLVCIYSTIYFCAFFSSSHSFTLLCKPYFYVSHSRVCFLNYVCNSFFSSSNFSFNYLRAASDVSSHSRLSSTFPGVNYIPVSSIILSRVERMGSPNSSIFVLIFSCFNPLVDA